MANINLLDAVKYSKNLPAHIEAWTYLDGVITEEQRLHFQELYRKPAPQKPAAAEIYLYCKWSGKYDEESLKIFGLYLMNGDKVVDKVAVCSGQNWAQDVVWPTEDTSGSMRPCPEGVYDIGAVDDLGYDPGSSDGYGQWVIAIEPRAKIQRSLLRLHSDRNRITSPGSAGCLVTYDEKNMGRVVAWCMAKAKPTYLIMDHGLGFLKEQGVKIPSLGK